MYHIILEYIVYLHCIVFPENVYTTLTYIDNNSLMDGDQQAKFCQKTFEYLYYSMVSKTQFWGGGPKVPFLLDAFTHRDME